MWCCSGETERKNPLETAITSGPSATRGRPSLARETSPRKGSQTAHPGRSHRAPVTALCMRGQARTRRFSIASRFSALRRICDGLDDPCSQTRRQPSAPADRDRGALAAAPDRSRKVQCTLHFSGSESLSASVDRRLRGPLSSTRPCPATDWSEGRLGGEVRLNPLPRLSAPEKCVAFLSCCMA
jgi:hypothetical protein